MIDGIILTNKQEQALDIACSRYRSGKKYTCVAGYAGSGKSTLAKIITQSLGLQSNQVVNCSYTGKAALVLKRKGNANATTLHKLLYKSVLTRDGTYRNIPKDRLNADIKLIIVDEISMVPMDLLKLLVKHNIHILAFGDPFQLPALFKNQDNMLLQSPHVFLDEIMRQEANSEIIQLSMSIRCRQPLQKFIGKQVQVIDKKDIITGHYEWADQIICSTNKTRREINSSCRKLKGLSGDPQSGDKVICLHNYWDDGNEVGGVMVNGTTGILYDPIIVFDREIFKQKIIGNFDTESDDGIFTDVSIDYNLFTQGTPSLTDKQIYYFMKNQIPIPKQFDFGDAITVWKSQGSEWDNVLLFEEAFPYEKEEHARALYTGITRAASKLVVVRKED